MLQENYVRRVHALGGPIMAVLERHIQARPVQGSVSKHAKRRRRHLHMPHAKLETLPIC